MSGSNPVHTLVPYRPAGGAAEQTLRRTPGPALGAATGRGQVVPSEPLGGAFEVVGTLGHGGLGIVHLARQQSLGRLVALKSVHPKAPAKPARRSLLQEARAAAALEHPNIVPIYDLRREADGAPHLVMRRIAGQTWAEYLGRPEQVQARFGARDLMGWHLGVLAQVCNAVHYAHSRGILHRDLKPENVMVGAFGEVYVLDWGLAARLSDAAPAALPRASADRRVVGTPRFMAPEMATGDADNLSERTDVYLLGGLLHCILAGQGPHPGDDPAEVLASIPNFRPRFPEGTPPRLAAVCAAALAAEPSLRPASAEALRLAVQDYLEQRAAERIAEQAHTQLQALEAAVARPQAARDREALQRHFAAARFGFQQALSAWPGHVAAAQGLQRALVAMAGDELDQGDLRAAGQYLGELEDPPEHLVARRAALVARAEQAAAREAREARDRDPTIGQRTRIFVASVMGLIWVCVPLTGWMLSLPLTWPTLFGGHVALLVLVVGLVVWARDSLGRTALNRRVAVLLVTIQVAAVLADLVLPGLGLDPTGIHTVELLLYGVVAALAGDALQRAAAPVAIAFGLAFVASVWWPAHTLLVTAVANGLAAAAMLALWLPAARGQLLPPR